MIEIPCAAILFDNDGVLVDSHASVVRAWSSWAIDRGLDPEVVMPTVHGRPSRDTVAVFVDEAERESALADVDARELEDAALIEALPGAVLLTDSLPLERWAIVTSATRSLGTARLLAAGIREPRCLITADDVSRGKPDPEGYLAGARALGFAPGDVIVFEDSPAGVAAARAAGVGTVIGVSESSVPGDPDVVVRDLRDVEWTGSGVRVVATLSR